MDRGKDTSSSKIQRGTWVSPFLVIFAIVFATSIPAVPVGYGLDPKGYFDLFRQGLDDSVVWQAYLWTLYALSSMLFLYYVLGTHRNISAFQRCRFKTFAQRTYRQLWAGSFALGLVLSAIMFAQAGFRIPILEGLGAEYWTYAKMRADFADLIDQRLFNTTLYLVATPNLILAWLFIHSSRLACRVLSSILFLLVSSFTLARSPVSFILLIVLNFILLFRPVLAKHVAYVLAGVIAIIVLVHFLVGAPGGYASRFDYLWARVIYGQWMTLPHYFVVFSGRIEPISALLPAPLQELLIGHIVEAPARTVIMEMVPGAVAEGTAGVASSFFIGEAYAVGGLAGVILSPLIVSLEIWIISICFRLLKVNFITTFLYAWFFFKMLLGLVSGFSAFVASSLQLMLLLVVYWALARQVALGSVVVRRRLISASRS